ncbi:MAG: hypothetical protein JSR34_06400 [Proteobacteria bacterium]|nr:hypothetical protein [Pseudomonadota bacterium]
MKFDSSSNLWRDDHGGQFILCEFEPERPVLISVSEDEWRATYAGNDCRIDWKRLDLPDCLAAPLKDLLKISFRKQAASSLASLDWTLRDFIQACHSADVDFSGGFRAIGAAQWRLVWKRMHSYPRTRIREIYRQLANRTLGGASQLIAAEMKGWKARNEVKTLRHVLEWDTKRGALTTAELEVVRRELREASRPESIRDKAVRLFTWTMLETLKRPTQILSMSSTALTVVGGKPADQIECFFLSIPPAKAQAGLPDALWSISHELGVALSSLSSHTSISKLRKKTGKFFVFPSQRGESVASSRGRTSTAVAGSQVAEWARERRIVSPRTKFVLHLKPTRLRHSGATAMAIQGLPRQVIQDVLEQDHPSSADAYIKAVGSDLFPAIEKASERGLGKIFEELSDSFFFKGSIGEIQSKGKVVIPLVLLDSTPAIVGNCRSGDPCARHPFWSCYDGCPHFLAWKEFDHRTSLAFVEAELSRWSKAEGSKERSKLFKDFERTAAAIRNVIGQIEDLDGE